MLFLLCFYFHILYKDFLYINITLLLLYLFVLLILNILYNL